MSNAVNLLSRGQSNMYLLLDFGGLKLLAQRLEAETGVKINVLADFDNSDKAATIFSGTSFLDWDTGGQQKSFLNFLVQQKAEVLANPTITLWAHNEYDQNKWQLKKDDWLGEVRADAQLIRGALKQKSETTPYVFTWVYYNYGNNMAPKQGMMDLVADKTFNATFCDAFKGAKMDYAGKPGGEHIGKGDVEGIVSALLPHLAPIVKALASGAQTAPQQPSTPAPATPTPAQPTQPATPAPVAREVDWTATQAAVMAYFNKNGRWPIDATPLYVYKGGSAVQPQPTPAPQPVKFSFEIAAHSVDGWKLGQPVSLAVEMSGYTAWKWVYVSGLKGNPWVGSTREGKGTTLPFTPNAYGDFVKAWPLDKDGNAVMAAARDSLHMPPVGSPVPQPDPVPQPVPTVKARVKAFKARLGRGLNIERRLGESISKAQLQEYKSQGIGWVRFFAGTKASQGTMFDSATIERYIRTMRDANSVGLMCEFAFMDWVEEKDLGNAQTLPYVKRVMKQLAAANLDPEMNFFNAVNEYNFGSNAKAQPYREAYAALFASELPKFIFASSSGDWTSLTALVNGTFKLSGNDQEMAEWHAYDDNADSLAKAQAYAADAKKWGDANGVSVFCGEWNMGPADGKKEQAAKGQKYGENRPRHPGAVSAMVKGLCTDGEAAAAWTATDGAWWRLNEDGSYKLRAEIAAAFAAK